MIPREKAYKHCFGVFLNPAPAGLLPACLFRLSAVCWLWSAASSAVPLLVSPL